MPDSTTSPNAENTMMVCFKEKIEPIEEFDDFLPELERECQALIATSRSLVSFF
jgi:hypothetical protein